MPIPGTDGEVDVMREPVEELNDSIFKPHPACHSEPSEESLNRFVANVNATARDV